MIDDRHVSVMRALGNKSGTRWSHLASVKSSNTMRWRFSATINDYKRLDQGRYIERDTSLQ